jgi:hypothetical protein
MPSDAAFGNRKKTKLTATIILTSEQQNLPTHTFLALVQPRLLYS